MNTTYRRRYLSERNKTAVMVVCTPSWLVWLLLAMHLALLAVEGALLALLKRDRRVWGHIYGPALSHVLHHLGSLRATRRAAQLTRKISLPGYIKGFSPTWRKLGLLWRYGIPEMR